MSNSYHQNCLYVLTEEYREMIMALDNKTFRFAVDDWFVVCDDYMRRFDLWSHASAQELSKKIKPNPNFRVPKDL